MLLRKEIKYFFFNLAMDSAVALALKLGETKVTGKCVGVNPATGQQIIFSQDSVNIFVIPLDKIKIKTPLTRIRSGAVMPATLWGKQFFSSNFCDLLVYDLYIFLRCSRYFTNDTRYIATIICAVVNKSTRRR